MRKLLKLPSFKEDLFYQRIIIADCATYVGDPLLTLESSLLAVERFCQVMKCPRPIKTAIAEISAVSITTTVFFYAEVEK